MADAYLPIPKEKLIVGIICLNTHDEQYMRLALEEARLAYDKNEVPVGAILVHEGRVIARAHNLIESSCDATQHAEMLCLRMAFNRLGSWRLTESVLYCTLEPCAMCAGAMLLSRLGQLVWSAKDLRHGAHGSWTNLLDLAHPMHRIQVRRGPFDEECAALMRAFFRERRKPISCDSCGCGEASSALSS